MLELRGWPQPPRVIAGDVNDRPGRVHSVEWQRKANQWLGLSARVAAWACVCVPEAPVAFGPGRAKGIATDR
eukprot:5899139-Alexandrium_andersonii.AAC.1